MRRKGRKPLRSTLLRKLPLWANGAQSCSGTLGGRENAYLRLGVTAPQEGGSRGTCPPFQLPVVEGCWGRRKGPAVNYPELLAFLWESTVDPGSQDKPAGKSQSWRLEAGLVHSGRVSPTDTGVGAGCRGCTGRAGI